MHGWQRVATIVAMLLVAAFALRCGHSAETLAVADFQSLTRTPWYDWIDPREAGAVVVTITGWIQDEAGNPVKGDAYVELSQLNDAGWPVLVLERKYLFTQHSFAFQRALGPGTYAVILDDADLAGWACAEANHCWHEFTVAAEPLNLRLVWTMRKAPLPTITIWPTETPTVIPSQTLTVIPSQTPTDSPSMTPTPWMTATLSPTFTPGPCTALQQFTLQERLTIIAAAFPRIGDVESNPFFVDDETLYYGMDEHLGAPLTQKYVVEGEDGQTIICRAFAQAIVAIRVQGDVGPHCYQYGLVDWTIYGLSLEELPRGE